MFDSSHCTNPGQETLSEPWARECATSTQEFGVFLTCFVMTKHRGDLKATRKNSG